MDEIEQTQTTNETEQTQPVASPVTIGEVIVTEPITADHVLASQGIVTVVNKDGSISQMKKEDALAEMDRLRQLKEKLEGKI